MVAESFREYLSRHYTIYICSDSLKQTDRIRAIFEDRGDNISFTAVERTLHEALPTTLYVSVSLPIISCSTAFTSIT